jgi:hypothetical protein
MQRLSLWGVLFAIIVGSAGCYVVPAQEAVRLRHLCWSLGSGRIRGTALAVGTEEQLK